jgi:hypothetical protein
VGLLAAVDRFVLKEVQTETILRPPAEAFTPAGRTKPLALPFQTAHTYQIMPCTLIALLAYVSCVCVCRVWLTCAVCVVCRVSCVADVCAW